MAPSVAVRPMAAPDLGLEAKAKGVAALAQGFASMAGSMGSAAQDASKQQDALDLIKADTSFHQGMGDIQNGLADNGDYDTHADTFNRQTSQLIPQAADQIRNPQAREAWALRAGLKAVDAGQRVASNAGALRRQDQQVQLLDQLGTRQQQYLTGQTDEDRESALQDMSHYIQMGQDSRLISPVQAQKYRQQFLVGSVYSELGDKLVASPERTIETITGRPYALTPQGDQQTGAPAPSGTPSLMGPTATMMGQPGAQVAPQQTAGEILGTPTADKPLQDRLVPAFSGQQPQEGQTQTVPNPFLNGQSAEGRASENEAGARESAIHDYMDRDTAQYMQGQKGAQAAPAPGNGQAARPASPHAALMAPAMDQLRKEGVPEASLRAAAAHLVGQADMESGLNPEATHDNGAGYGIYGAGGDRQGGMLKWMSDNGYQKNSAEGQIRYMAHEAMTGPAYQQTRDVLMKANQQSFGPDSKAITVNFERPAVINDRSEAVARAYAVSDQPNTASERAAPPIQDTHQQFASLNPGAALATTDQVERGQTSSGYGDRLTGTIVVNGVTVVNQPVTSSTYAAVSAIIPPGAYYVLTASAQNITVELR